MSNTCGSCQQTLGTNGSCDACLQYKLQRDSENMSDSDVRARLGAAEQFAQNPPWYAKLMPKILWNRFLLLLKLLSDATAGRHDIPWSTIVAVAAAVAYVVSPVDLIPDILFPLGYTDDAAVVALLFQAIGGDLKEYVEAKGLEPDKYKF